MRPPRVGSRQERDVIEAAQPGFLAAAARGVHAARGASTVDGQGNTSHTAVQSYLRFTLVGLRISARRALDPTATPLERKLQEVDLIDAWAWWLVSQVGVNTETAWSYVCVANAWHERHFGVGFAAGLSLQRVKGMLDGMQQLSGRPVARRRRIGVRPAHLAAAIACSDPANDALDANYAALFECGLVGLLRGSELAAGKRGFSLAQQPSRADVEFEWRDGELCGATIMVVNCKARGAERLRRLPVRLPARGAYLSPARALWHLLHVVDPTPSAAASVTPLFRNPRTGAGLTSTQCRDRLRALLAMSGRDASVYGLHSLRIGGATAMAWLRAPPSDIKDAGRWKSDAYLRYVRALRSRASYWAEGIASADVDDYEADYVAVDDDGFSSDDEM